MSRDWSKWGREFWSLIARHVGTAGLTWLSLGLKDGKVDWRSLWVALLVGGILPSAFTFLQSNPCPDEDSCTPPTAKPL